MCGFTGLIHPCSDANTLYGNVVRMAETMTHRGPDDSGVWFEGAAGVALAHRRLSIIDLSQHGHQPMVSPSGRYVLVFNGEIYNYRVIRRDLVRLGHSFIGECDTEILLAALAHWGVAAALGRLNGMFAFALWDRRDQSLYLARDRIGEKPLYYGRVNGVFLFGSELKALHAHPDFDASVNPSALTSFMRFGYVPTPHSIYSDVFKLTPGHWLRIDANNLGGQLASTSYWDANSVLAKAHANPVDLSDDEATDQLEAILRDAVRLRMVADVPLGAFLSGGFDSSMVAALMQSQSNGRVHTFAIGNNVRGYDEAVHARAVAKHLGTNHTELYVSSEDALAVIPRLPKLYDEPFADSSQIPTYLVSALARNDVTVSLSGDGGDELFAGYNRYFWARKLWNTVARWPYGVRASLAKLLLAVPPKRLDILLRPFARQLPSELNADRGGERLHKLASALGAQSTDDLYRRLTSLGGEPANLMQERGELSTLIDTGLSDEFTDMSERMMMFDLLTYLPDDILTKVDRASMGVSLEARVPLLDHRLVEFAWSLPLSVKLRDGHGKWLLREVLYRYVPRELMERPKQGFGAPIGQWLRGPLRDWAEHLLDEKILREQGYLNPVTAREIWREHLSGQRNWEHKLWNVLMFQAWHEEWV